MKFLLPTYNNTQGLKKLIRHTNKNDEILINDNSLNDKIQKISKKFKNIKYERNYPDGALNNWNNILNRAINQFVIIVHDDEFFLKADIDKLKSLKKEKGYVYILKYKVFNKKKIINQSINDKLRYFLITKFPKLCLFVNFIGPTSSYIFYNKQFQYDKNLNWLVDMDFFYKLIKNKNIKMVPITVNTEVKKNSITNLSIQNKYVTELKEFLYFKKKYRISFIVFILYYFFSLILRLYLKSSNFIMKITKFNKK